MKISKKKIEDIKLVTRIRKSKKGGQCNGQKTKDEKTNNTPQNTTQKTINLSKTNPTGSKLTFFKIRSKRLFVKQVFFLRYIFEIKYGISRYICVAPVPRHDSDSPYLLSRRLVVLSNLKWEVIVRFVDIGEIVDHYIWYWWNCWPLLLILVKLLTITFDIGEIVDHYFFFIIIDFKRFWSWVQIIFTYYILTS